MLLSTLLVYLYNITAFMTVVSMIQCSYVGPGGDRCETQAPRTLQHFHPHACALLHLGVGSRGAVCIRHSKYDVCAAQIKGVCGLKASPYWDGERRDSRPLTTQMCNLANLDADTLVSSPDLADCNRICSTCRRYALALPTAKFRSARYAKCDRRTKATVVTTSVEPVDVEWIIQEDVRYCPPYIRSFFVGKDHRKFIGVFVNNELCAARAIPPRSL